MSDPKTNDSESTQPEANSADHKEGANGTPAAEQLSKEEQWALFEKELKESDWGHQPC